MARARCARCQGVGRQAVGALLLGVAVARSGPAVSAVAEVGRVQECRLFWVFWREYAASSVFEA